MLVASLAAVALLLGSALTTDAEITTEPASVTGFELLEERLPGSEVTRETVVVRSEDGAQVAEPAYREFVERLAADLGSTGVTAAVVTGADDPTLVSEDGQATLLGVQLADQETADEDVAEVLDVVRAADADPGFEVDVTGTATLNSDFLDLSNSDLKKGELYFGLPAALVVLLLVFGTVVAGAVPLLLAFVAIPVTIGVAAVVGQVWQLSFIVVNMVIAMGLALGIDYSLFVVSRYREERRAGRDRLASIEVAGSTASVAVLFSGLSFTVALLGLLLVPDTILRSLAAGAIITGFVTVAAALTLLPAVLSLLGDRVDALPIPFVHSAERAGSEGGRFWPALVRAVTRRPAAYLAVATGLLLLAAAPVLRLETGQNGIETLPDSTVSKQGYLAVERAFPGVNEADPARVVVDGDVTAPQVQEALERVQAELAASPLFGGARLTTQPEASLAVLDVALPGAAAGEPAQEALAELREDIVPAAFAGSGATAYVTGGAAFNADYASLMDRWLPRVIGFVLLLTFLLLTLVFRSVVLPLKAVLLNLLSVGAAYGLLVLVFQEGVGAGLLGLTEVATVETWVPVFLFSVLFALSMDYHVFLLSRVRERWVQTGDTVDAVAHGIGSTGRIITGAALIIVVVFSGFAAGDLVMFQQMGFGVAVALLLDATIVRSVIVPSSMALLGRWNWYLPRWLSWLPEVHVEGEQAAAGQAAPADGVPVPRRAGEPQPQRERA